MSEELNEELNIEESRLSEEFSVYSEFNSSARAEEFASYSSEGGYLAPEDSLRGGETQKDFTARHAAVMRNSRNRLGRLLGMLATVAGTGFAVIIAITAMIIADVTGYTATPDSLEVKLILYSSQDDTEFEAVLSDSAGVIVSSVSVDRKAETLMFSGLSPGGLYYLEIFGGGKSLLKLNYLLPTQESDPDPERDPETEPVTEPLPIPSVTVRGSETTFSSFTLRFRTENVDPSALSVFIDGQQKDAQAEDDSLVLAADGLDPDTDYTVSVTDADGNELYSGSVTTGKRTPAQIAILSHSIDLGGAKLEFSYVNPDGNDVSAKLDGKDISFTAADEKIVLSFNDLAENSQHTVEFFDWDGSTIVSYPFATRSREAASVTLDSSDVGFDSAKLVFTINNPDANAITLQFDDLDPAELPEDETSCVEEYDDLVSGETHTLVFTDWDGTVLLSYSFAARERTPASVTFTSVSAGFNRITAALSVDNPDGNTLELRLNGDRVDADLSGSAPSIDLTGLSPRTAYTLTVADLSLGTDAATAGADTGTSLTWSQDGNGNATFTLTDEFTAEYPASSVSLALNDGFGAAIPVTSNGSGGFTATAADIVYGDTYTVALYSGGNTADSLNAYLTGKARPSFTISYTGYLPATTAQALADTDYHVSGTTYPTHMYLLSSGYIEPFDEQLNDPDGTVKRNWSALVIKDPQGRVTGIIVTGFERDTSITRLGEEVELYFQQENDQPQTLVAGTYTAALYTVGGYSQHEMENVIWGDGNNKEPTAAEIAAVFTGNGRRISSEVRFTVANTTPLGDAYFYSTSDPIIDRTNDNTSYYFSCSYYPVTDGTTEGFLALVSASDPSTPLTLDHPDADAGNPTRISLGKDGNYGIRIERLAVPTTGPVYAIIYSGTFSPSNFLYVQYIDPQ